MRVVVTGVFGFVGSHLARRLALNNHPVAGIDIAEASHPWYGDILDRHLVDHFRGAEVVFHLAAESSVLRAESNRELSFDTNVLGTLHVLNAAAAAGVRRVVFTSSREVYGQAHSIPVRESAELHPRNHYGATKAAAEMFCSAFRDVEVTVLRLSNVYGPGDRGRVITEFIGAALDHRPLTIFGSGKILDLLWIEDAIDALCRAAVYPVAGKVFNIGSGVPVQLPELAGHVVRLTGTNSPVRMAARREVEVDSYVADISLAKRLLDFKPETQLTAGLEQTIISLSRDTGYPRVTVNGDTAARHLSVGTCLPE